MDFKMAGDFLFGLLGGLGLFLFGMKLMSEGMQKVSSAKLKRVLSALVSNRFMGLLAGLGVTSVIQSSSATTVMLVGFVNAGLMSFVQSISVIFGANIGTTVTAQIIAFKIEHWALPAIGVGALLKLFYPKRRERELGEALLGFGLIFLGLTVMKNSFIPVRESEKIRELLMVFSSHSLTAVLIGAAITILIQSSSATVGITMAMASAGLIDFYGAVGLVLGENIGTTVTALIASIGTNVSAKRTALAHALFNCIGVSYMLLILPHFVRLVDLITPGQPDMIVLTKEEALRLGAIIGTKPFIARHIANAHTLFNVINALIFLPFIDHLAALVRRILPEKEGATEFHLVYLDYKGIDAPSLAVAEAKEQVVKMAEVIKRMLEKASEAYLTENGDIVERVVRDEEWVDNMRKEITNFLVKISQKSITGDLAKDINSYIYIVNNLERIADLSEGYALMVDNKRRQGLSFSPKAHHDLLTLQGKVKEFIELIVSAIKDYKLQNPDEIYKRARELESSINAMEDRMRNSHVERLWRQECDSNAGLIFIDILTNFEKIGDHCFNIVEMLTGRK